MKHAKSYNAIAAVLLGVSTAFISAGPAFAQTAVGGLSVSASASTSAAGTGIRAQAEANLVVRAKTRADEEISRRIRSLTALETRINAVQRLSADEKASLSATIQGQIGAMKDLQAKIGADTDRAALKADLQSIAKTYRIYILVIPQSAIMAASDRALQITDLMDSLSAKLQERISAAETAGHDMSASVSALADFNAKIADAKVQANAAITEVASLKPDNGDQSVHASNTAALKDARSKIRAAQQDFVAARKDAGSIVRAVRGLEVNAAASSTVEASTSAE